MQSKEISHLSSLYGGFWTHNVLDFCYMTNRYFPPQRMIEDMQSRLPELIGSYPSTNWHLSSLLADQLGDRAAVTTQGHGRTCIRLAGSNARDLLPKGCTLDFHFRHFSVDDCAQTTLGHVNAMINCIENASTFDLFVPRSYAVSFWEWMTDASMEFGYKVIAAP